MTFDPYLIAVVGLAFACSGLVKGVVGFGLPAVSVAILAIALDIHTAIALIAIPAFITNLRQSLAGGHLSQVMKKTWPFLMAASVAVWGGVMALAVYDPTLLTLVLGCMLALYGVVSIAGLNIVIPARHDVWAGPSLGVITGFLAGMTGTASVPGVMYLRGIGLDKDSLIQAMGILFTLCALVLGIALQRHDLLSPQIALISTAALVPALLGMRVGEAVRRRISEHVFKKMFLSALVLMGMYLMFDSI